jgi:hypothetical protein
LTAGREPDILSFVEVSKLVGGRMEQKRAIAALGALA